MIGSVDCACDRLDRQFSAALDAAALNDRTTSLSGNASTESVSTGAVTRVWLMGSLWHISSTILHLPCFSQVSGLKIMVLVSYIYILSTNTLYLSTD